MGKLLRKPRAPKPLPPLPVTPAPNGRSSHAKLTEYFESIDFGLEDELPPAAKSRDTTIRHSPTPSVVPSLVSPPPSESNARKSVYRTVTYMSPQSRVSYISREEKKFVLDPIFRDQTSLGTYVDGKSLVKPYKARGPDPLPARAPRRYPELLHATDIVDDIRFYSPPAFTLENFVVHLSEVRGLPLRKVKEAVLSKHNYKKLTKLIAEESIWPQPTGELRLQHLTPEGQAIPAAEPRIPQKQLLIEMAAMIKQHVRSLMNTEVKSVIRPLPKYAPGHQVGAAPHTEIILVEDDQAEVSSQSQQTKQETEMPGKDAMFHAARSKYFQGSMRSQSPFTIPEEGMITPSELAILDSLIQGGRALSLKAHFIAEMPDISPLLKNLVYLNLSFNDFSVFPMAVLDIPELEILKLRNNPLKDLPPEINKLKKLRTLVVSFCMLQSLPIRLFAMEKLEFLDVSYNRISFIQNEIYHLQTLRELNLEGNQLPAMPSGALRLDLDHLNVKNNFMTRTLRELNLEGNQLPAMPSGALRLDLDHLNVKNNFMHPLFWHENTHNEPQRLVDLSLLSIQKSHLGKNPSQLPTSVQQFLRSSRARCDCCNGTMFGPGLRIIRPVTELFGIKNLPFMFRACSPKCLKDFKHSKDTLSDILYGKLPE